MSITSFKKILLAGTALVAVSAFSSQAQAVAPDTLAAGTTWASAGTQADVANDGTDAMSGDAVDVNNFLLTITNDGVAADAPGVNDIFTIGAITDGGASGDVLVTSAGGSGDVAVTAASLVINGDVNITEADGDDSTLSLDITGAATIGGNLALLNGETNTADTVTMTVGGNLGVTTGTTAITAGAFAGAEAELDVTGNAIFGDDVTIVAGAGIGSDAGLTVTGATITFGGANGLELTDGAAGIAELELDGAVTQTVTGTIDGGAAGNGTITVSNTSAGGVIFSDDVGATTNTVDVINIANDTNDVVATFNGNVSTANGITIGDGAGAVDAYTVNFNATGGTAVAGIVNGAAVDTATVNITGGTLTANAAWGGGSVIEAVNLSASGGLTTGAALTATTVTVGAGTTLTAGGTVTGAVNISGAAGTVALNDGIDVTGAINNTSGGAGVGVLTSASAGAGVSTVTGAVGATNSLSSVTLTGTGTFAFGSTVAAATISATDSGFFTFADDVTATTINIGTGAGDDATVTLAAGKNITAAITNATGTTALGTLVVDSTGDTNITGSVGGAAAVNALKLITLNGAGTTAFSSTVRAADITFGAAGTVTFADDVTVTNDIDFNNFAGTISLASGQNITGAVDNTGGAGGTLTLAGGTQSVSGAVGATNALTAINAGATGGASTFLGTVDATTITVTGNGTVQFGDNLADDVAGNLVFAGASTGTATFFDGVDLTGSIDGTGGVVGTGIGNVVFSGTTGTITTIGTGGVLDSMTLNGTIGVVETVTTTGNVAAADTTALNGNTLSVGGTFTLGAAQTLSATILTAGAPGTSGNVVSTGNAIIAAGAIVDMSIDAGAGFIAPGTYTWTVVDGAAAGGLVSDITAANILGNTALMTFSQVTANNDDLVIQGVMASAADVAGITPNAASISTAIEAIGANAPNAAPADGGVDLDDVVTTTQNAATVADLNEVYERLTPAGADGSLVTSMIDGTDTMGAIIDTRTEIAMNDDPANMTGMAAGASANGASMWLQGFGQAANQDARDNIDGYDADTWGLAVGGDTTNVVGNGLVGIMLTYGRTEAEADNANRTDTEIDSFGGSLYGSVDLDAQIFMNGQFGYAYNGIDTLRHDSDGVAGSGLNSAGDFNSNQWMARLALGRDYGADYGLTLTPSISAAYTYVDIDGYTETGTGANQVVGSQNLSALNTGVALKAAWKLQNADGSILEPALRAAYAYDVIGDQVETTSSFTGDVLATPFTTRGADPQRHRMEAGAGLTYMTNANWDLSANYNYTFKEDYDAHTGVLRMTSHF